MFCLIPQCTFLHSPPFHTCTCRSLHSFTVWCPCLWGVPGGLWWYCLLWNTFQPHVSCRCSCIFHSCLACMGPLCRAFYTLVLTLGQLPPPVCKVQCYQHLHSQSQDSLFQPPLFERGGRSPQQTLRRCKYPAWTLHRVNIKQNKNKNKQGICKNNNTSS